MEKNLIVWRKWENKVIQADELIVEKVDDITFRF